MRPNASGITSANTSHTIGSSNVRRIFATRSSVDSITCDIIRRRSKIYSLPFFDFNVELLMRAYIEKTALSINDLIAKRTKDEKGQIIPAEITAGEIGWSEPNTG